MCCRIEVLMNHLIKLKPCSSWLHFMFISSQTRFSSQVFQKMASAKIIGFAGVTNGGKTTTCRWLQASLEQQGVNVTHFTMDDYYWDEHSPNHVPLPEFDNTYSNWDDVCAVNWERLNGDIKGWRNKTNTISESDPKHVLLVEGIMIFNHRDLLPYFDKKYFFTLPKDECWERRKKRNYLPPEPEGYFDKIAWPYYLKLKEELHSQSDIVYVDGTRDQKEIFQEVKQRIKEHLQM